MHDPETLTQAHRRYLEHLKIELLLNDAEFTNMLRRFMNSIDHLSALMQRLSVVQQGLDSQGDNVAEEKSHLNTEARTVMDQLRTARSKVATETQALIDSLRSIDSARNSGRQYKGVNVMAEDGFLPWTGGGIDRLLLKFDYGNIDRISWAAA